MQLEGNTVLVTGGATGIGRGLAESFHRLGNRVVIAGRRQKVLAEVVAANPGMESAVLDVEDAAAVRVFADDIATRFPSLNVLINNAGIMRAEDLTAPEYSLADAEASIATNLLGPIRLTTALLPLLLQQPRATVMNVSSGLAFVSLSLTPTYCATKAAIHSYTQSLRWQLRERPVDVIELIPPYVATDLMRGASDPRAMPLSEFITEVMQILKSDPDVIEICVERVKGLRFAERSGNYDGVFRGLNESMKAADL